MLNLKEYRLENPATIFFLIAANNVSMVLFKKYINYKKNQKLLQLKKKVLTTVEKKGHRPSHKNSFLFFYGFTNQTKKYMYKC